MKSNEPEEFKKKVPDVIIAPKKKVIACSKCGNFIEEREDFGDVLLAIHHNLYRKNHCSVGANKWKLGDLAQIEKWFEYMGLEIIDRWEYKFGDNKEGFAIEISVPKKNL